MRTSGDGRRRPGRREIRQLVAIFVAIGVVVMILGVSGEPAGARSTLVGSPAPDFIVASGEGGSLRLSDLKGHPVWLNFFSTWCTRCRAENPDIQAVYEEQERVGSDLVILAVGVAESRESVNEYAKNAGLTFRIAADGDRTASRRYSVLALPTHAFIDRDGIVREIRIGALPPATMRALVASIAAPPAAQR